jgi:transcription termination/antitermination protein NusG
MTMTDAQATESKWYVVQVMSSQEKKIKKTLEENRAAAGMAEMVEQVVLPTEKVSEVKQGERRVVERRIWPGYLLVKMKFNEDSWAYVRGTNGVVDFLGGEHPNPLSEDEVATILEELEEKKGAFVHKRKLAPGDNVKITDGVFVNFVGTVVEVDEEKGRLSVMVSIFGRDTRVDDLEFWQVEEASEEEAKQG